MSFERYIGKEVETDWWDDTKAGIVVHIDYDIGITVVHKGDKSRNLVCLNGPMSPNKWNYECTAHIYDELFELIVNQIKNGLLAHSILVKVEEGWGIYASGNMAACPYNP